MAPPEKQSDRPGYQTKISSRLRSSCKHAWLKGAHRGYKILSAYKRLPRLFQLGVVYLALGLVAGGVFCWQIWNLKAAHPYINENNPDITEFTQDNYPLEITATDRPAKEDPLLSGMENDQEHKLMPPPMEPQGNSNSAIFSSGLQQNAVWPVSGELWHNYHDLITCDLNPRGVKYCFSKGLAIKADPGTEVRAAWEGIVTKVSKQGYPCGQAVTLEHDNGLTVYYGALQELVVEEGSHLRQGERIGYLAGGSDGDPSHLYLEFRENRKPVDPLLYLP